MLLSGGEKQEEKGEKIVADSVFLRELDVKVCATVHIMAIKLSLIERSCTKLTVTAVWAVLALDSGQINKVSQQ